MNAENFRHAFDYHFTFSRLIWDKSITTLSDGQFLQDLPYSIGSIRNQTVHMMSVDQRWFSGLRGVDVTDHLDPISFTDRESVRSRWDSIEAVIREYLNGLIDDDLQKPFNQFQIWQVLLHVINHGTDHRAQVLAMLNSLGAPSFPQDYIYFVMGVDPSEPRK